MIYNFTSAMTMVKVRACMNSIPSLHITHHIYSKEWKKKKNHLFTTAQKCKYQMFSHFKTKQSIWIKLPILPKKLQKNSKKRHFIILSKIWIIPRDPTFPHACHGYRRHSMRSVFTVALWWNSLSCYNERHHRYTFIIYMQIWVKVSNF